MKKRYLIGEVAQIKNIDKQTLRYYNKLGILVPEVIDEETGYRYYSIKQFIDVDRIKFCKRMGLSLEETRSFMVGKNLNNALDILKEKRQSFADEISRLEAIYDVVDGIVNSIEETVPDANNEITIEHREDFYGIVGNRLLDTGRYDFEVNLLDLTNRHPKYYEVGHNFGLIMRLDLESVINTELEENRTTILRVDKRFKNDENITEIQLGKCVVLYHRGSRLKRPLFGQEVVAFINENELKAKGDVYVYPIVNRFIVDDVNEYVYEILIPIEG